MTEKRFVLCQGKRVALFEANGWWYCGLCGTALWEVGATYQVDKVSA